MRKIEYYAKRASCAVRLALTKYLLTILCLLALPLLIVELVSRYYLQGLRTTVELWLLGLIFLITIVAQAGNLLLARIKKVGPVEFHDRVTELRDDFWAPHKKLEVPADVAAIKWPPEPISPERKHAFEEARVYLAFVDYSGQFRPGDVPNRKLSEMFLRVGGVATSLGLWSVAVERLERLDELSKGQYKPAEVRYRCGLAYCLWASRIDKEEKKKEVLQKKKELFEKAESWLQRAAKASEVSGWRHRRWVFFWLAYAEDELGRYPQAIKNLRKAINLEKKMALAKYNSAVAWTKRENLQLAFKKLKEIERDDEGFSSVAEAAPRDPELEALRETSDFELRLKVDSRLRECQRWSRQLGCDKPQA